MKKLFLLFAFSFFNTCIWAQKDTIKPELLFDDPLTVPNFDIYLAPCNLGTYGVSPFLLTGGAGVNARFINSLIEISGFFEISYTKKGMFSLIGGDKAINDGYTHPNNASVKIQQDFKRFFTYDAGLKFKIKDQTKRQDVNITLKSNRIGSATEGRTRIDYYLVNVLPTEANLRRILKVRAGYNYLSSRFIIVGNKSRIADSGDEFSSDAVKYTNVHYSGYHDKSMIPGGDDYSFRNFESNVSVHSIYIGFESEKIMNILFKTPYGKRGIQKRSSFYLDVLFAPSISVDNV